MSEVPEKLCPTASGANVREISCTRPRYLLFFSGVADFGHLLGHLLETFRLYMRPGGGAFAHEFFLLGNRLQSSRLSAAKERQPPDATKTLLNIAGELADVLPSLSSCLESINALIEQYKVLPRQIPL